MAKARAGVLDTRVLVTRSVAVEAMWGIRLSSTYTRLSGADVPHQLMEAAGAAEAQIKVPSRKT